ncbi:MAG: NadS family protein [Dehalococcoidia bacterium]
MGKAFDEIQAGLIEAIDHASGKKNSVVVHRPQPVDVKAIRQKTGMSQKQFSSTFGLSVGTLRHWEQGDRSPKGAALVLLNVVDKNPDAVLEALVGETDRTLTTA